MKTLVFVSHQNALEASVFDEAQNKSIWSTTLNSRRAGMKNPLESEAMVEQLCSRMTGGIAAAEIDLIAIRISYGGAVLDSPVLFDERTEENLMALAAEAPFHLPGQLNLARACRKVLPNAAIVLVCETAFFLQLPLREQLYALDRDGAGLTGLRRYGFHGIYHTGAALWAIRHRPRDASRPPRILSICLEPKPELAAIQGLRPVMVTSGATPLEGIPGETSCGEIDPDIVITLAKQRGWGPERIDTVLSQQSGLRGLLGYDAKLPEIFENPNEACSKVREIFQYRLLRAAGAALAALNGLDQIVFSGRYAQVAMTLGPWLAGQLEQARVGRTAPLSWGIVPASLHDLIAEQSLRWLRQTEAVPVAGHYC